MDAATLIAKHEGTRLRVYDDATGDPIGPGSVLVGHPTIGTGRALDTHGISDAENALLRDNDIAECETDLETIFDTWASFSPARQAALLDMRFNLGPHGLRAFVTMIGCVRNGDWSGAARAALDSKWATEVPTRAQEDAAILNTGEFQ